MPTINFSGLSTGIDSSAIVDQMVKLERAPARLLEQRVGDLRSQLSVVGDLTSKLQSLKDEAAKLDSAGEVRAFAASSSNEDRVRITSAAATAPGSYSIRVNRLAAAETSSSSSFATADPGVVGTGSVTITAGGNPAVIVSYGASDSLADIAARINDQVTGVNASVLFDGTNYRILVAGEATGVANAMGFADSGSSLGFADPGAELVAAQDAELTVNGVTVTRATNSFSDVIDGVTMELRGVSQAAELDTVVDVDFDVAATRDRVQKFVDAYNAVAGLIDGQLSYNGVARGRDTLFGDSTLRGLRGAMSGLIATAYAHGAGTTSLGVLGVELTEQGTLQMDGAKFDAAVAADPKAIEHVFAGDGGAAISAGLSSLVDDYTRAGDGMLVAKTTGINSRIDAYDEQIQRVELRATKLGERLNRQFTQLEALSSRLQSQLSYLAALAM